MVLEPKYEKGKQWEWDAKEKTRIKKLHSCKIIQYKHKIICTGHDHATKSIESRITAVIGAREVADGVFPFRHI